MRVVFVSDTFHHHQKPLSDEMFKLTNGEYIFYTTGQMREERKRMGWIDRDKPSYVVEVNFDDPIQIENVKKKIADADIAITGSAPLSLFSLRNKLKKITFRYSERLYKTKSRYLKSPIHTLRALWMKNDYMLCSSAYTAGDYSVTGCYIGKCFKWGYFTELRTYPSIESLFKKKGNDNVVRIIWVSRFIPLKHPEIPLMLAEKLKKDGVSFFLHMIGIGPMRDLYRKKLESCGLSDYVMIEGPMSPNEVRDCMEQSDIFLFTSDRREGWGAVLNEAMNSGCAVVANRKIGSVPYLVEDGKNGETYEDGDIEDAYNKLYRLVKDEKYRRLLGLSAYETISQKWNANKAAINLLNLYTSLNEGKSSPVEEGPCSIALPMMVSTSRSFNEHKYSLKESLNYLFKDLFQG